MAVHKNISSEGIYAVDKVKNEIYIYSLQHYSMKCTDAYSIFLFIFVLILQFYVNRVFPLFEATGDKSKLFSPPSLQNFEIT